MNCYFRVSCQSSVIRPFFIAKRKNQINIDLHLTKKPNLKMTGGRTECVQIHRKMVVQMQIRVGVNS